MVAAWHRAADSVASFLLVGICAGLALVAVVLFDGGCVRTGTTRRTSTGTCLG